VCLRLLRELVTRAARTKTVCLRPLRGLVTPYGDLRIFAAAISIEPQNGGPSPYRFLVAGTTDGANKTARSA